MSSPSIHLSWIFSLYVFDLAMIESSVRWAILFIEQKIQVPTGFVRRRSD